MKRRNAATLADMLLCVCLGVGTANSLAATTDPTDATTPVPAATYQSPFAEYRALGQDRNTAWRDANDTVGRIGGWRTYAREAADAMKAREAAMATKTRPATPPIPPATPPAPTHKHGG